MSTNEEMLALLDEEICPSVLLKLGKKEFRLAFSMASVLAFKKVTGRNLFVGEGWQGFNLREDPEAIVAFFWSALQTFHPEVTLDQATRLANFGNMRVISEKCNECLMVFMPVPDPNAGETGEPTMKPQQKKSIGSGTSQ